MNKKKNKKLFFNKKVKKKIIFYNLNKENYL